MQRDTVGGFVAISELQKLEFEFVFKVAQMLRLCFGSNDELCHFALIHWMMERNMIDQLLEVFFGLKVFVSKFHSQGR